MKLYHYSDKDFKVISPKYYEKENNITQIPCCSFYLEPKPEQRLKNCKYCYIIEIPCSKLYDLREDREKLKIKYQGNMSLLLRYIKDNFLGCIYSAGFNIVILFNDIQVIAKTFK